VRDETQAPAIRAALADVPGVAAVGEPERGEPGAQLAVTLGADPFGADGFALIPDLRAAVGDAALVGGPTAREHDIREAAARDTLVIVPIALLVVLAVLALLLRAVVAPLLLIGTVIASFAAALGIGTFCFENVFGFEGMDPTLPVLAFVFLVALGVDYNIFLMARAREETARHGTREGIVRALAVTGGVITSAGLVLAGTFSVLASIPLVFLTELGFVIAVGVLLDTFLVRSLLVPALVLDIGDRTWWPQLRRTARDGAEPRETVAVERS
jgi:putative drug exporter of the RND superfamily